jgi:nitrate reductase NapE
MPGVSRSLQNGASQRRRMEIYAFLIVTVVLMPAIAVATVGAWGLTVWIYQTINGPPGPPKSEPRHG